MARSSSKALWLGVGCIVLLLVGGAAAYRLFVNADHPAVSVAAGPPPPAATDMPASLQDLAALTQSAGPALTPEEAFKKNAATPFSTEAIAPAAPFALGPASEETRSRAIECLALPAYYLGNAKDHDQAEALVQVVLNRLRHPAYAKTICGVVFQGSSLPDACQFSFTCDGSLAEPRDPVRWAKAQQIAQRALSGYVFKGIGNATYFHAIWTSPPWAQQFVKLKQVGDLLFYRYPGPWGEPAAFREVYEGKEPWSPLMDDAADAAQTVASGAIGPDDAKNMSISPQPDTASSLPSPEPQPQPPGPSPEPPAAPAAANTAPAPPASTPAKPPLNRPERALPRLPM